MPLRKVFKEQIITLSQVEARLIDKDNLSLLNDQELNALVLEAKKEHSNGFFTDKLWKIFKSDVKRRYVKYKRKLKEVGFDYIDYQEYAYGFLLKKIKTFDPERNVPFKAYFLKFLGPEMNKWANRKIYITVDNKRVQKHARLLKEWDNQSKKEQLNFENYLIILKKYKDKYCIPMARAKVISGSSREEIVPLQYVPILRRELKDIFTPDNFKTYSCLLRGRQKEVFEMYFGVMKVTEKMIAAEMKTTQQNVSKHLKASVEKIFNYYLQQK